MAIVSVICGKIIFAMSNLPEVDDRNFKQEVLESSSPVFVDFWADWCGPCRQVMPLIEEIAKEHPNFQMKALNVDNSPETAQEYSVISIPTMIVFKNGKEVKRLQGSKQKPVLEKELQEFF